MQYENWTWMIWTAFLKFNLGLDWLLMVLMSLIFLFKKFLVFLVPLVFSFSISLDVFSISCNCSIMMNLACKLILCPVWLKCLSTGMALRFLTSLLWLFNRILKTVSAFPTYWVLQSSMKLRWKYEITISMMKLLLQVVFWNIEIF